VTLIPGDGIGQEITESVKEIFESVNAPIEWDQYDVSGMSSSGEALFKQAMESLKRNKVGLKGPSPIIPFFCIALTAVKASYLLLSPSPATSPGMSLCVNNSIFMLL
jgi:isocitrate dehydrogenase